MRASSLSIGAFVVLASALAWAQAPGQGAKARSPQEEKRRKLLEGMGLQKQKDSPPPAAPAIPDTAAPESPGVEQSAEPEADGAKAKAKTTAAAPAAPSFRRVIHPMLMATCSACHRPGGSAAATRLTLSGDATADHASVVRVVATKDPATSALLTKASGQPHGGGSPWPPESAPYGRILAWIARGARSDAEARAAEPAATPPPPVVPPAPKKSAGAPLAGGAPPVPPVAAAPEAAPPSTATPSAAPPAPSTATATAQRDLFADAHKVLMTSCAACHKAGAPAGMTRLVLSGDGAADEAVARTLLEPAAPDRSPLLTKAAGVMHGGGAVLPESDPRYAVLVAWATPSKQETPEAGAPGTASPTAAGPAAVPPPPPAPYARPGYPHHGGIGLPYGFLVNGRFDLNYERRQYTGSPFDEEGVNALRNYHHFLFLSRMPVNEPCGFSVEILALTFWEAHCRLTGRSRVVAVTLSGGKILVPFGADPLFHQSYGGLAGFDQRIVPVIWTQEGVAAHAVYERGDLVISDDLFMVRGYGLPRADSVLNLQNDFSPADDVRLGWGNRLGAAWRGISVWYSAYYNPLGFDRHLFMQALDVTVYRQRHIPVLGHFTFGAGLFRADVAGGEDSGVGGVGKDYYHFGNYLQVRYYPTDWLYVQYRTGLRTFDNRRDALVLDNSRLTSADGSTHNFAVVGRYRGLTAGIYYFINLEKVNELPDDFLRVSMTIEF